MPEENMNQEFRLQKIDEIRKYLIEEIDRNELMSKKHRSIKKFVEFWIIVITWLIVISKRIGCVSIPAFASLVVIPIGITSSAIWLKICVLTAGSKRYKSINKKKKKKQDIIIFLANSKLNNTEVLISKALIDSNTSHDEFVLINNALKECYDIKEENKNSNNK